MKLWIKVRMFSALRLPQQDIFKRIKVKMEKRAVILFSGGRILDNSPVKRI
ncbi:hypothetical protein [Candidatus Endomicrobium trichonymphae]|uniref:hypothetical protein n=1 Tax=Endomicrobium trichonymphae TaxID=1408204 RepID=UPI0003242356